MKPGFLEDLDVKKAIRYAMLSQVALAGLLVLFQVSEHWPALGPGQRSAPATGPVTPGDQRREYRTDRPTPDLMTGPPGADYPGEFPDRLAFLDRDVDPFGAVLMLSGQIAPGDADRFARELEARSSLPERVVLHSPGGSVGDAQEIGRMLRARELSTAVLAGGYCVSACPYVLAAGIDRQVSESGIVGMHQHYYDATMVLPAMFAVKDIQFSQGETLQYLIDMGIAPSLMLYSLQTPPEEIYALVRDELLETGLATSVTD